MYQIAIAKLMIYLVCVATVIDYHDRTLTDYQNYNELSGEELVAVYQVAKLLNPSLFINAGIFIVSQDLLLDLDNQFYEISDETLGFHVNSEIMIGGKVVKVLKVMACNNRWLQSNYFSPISEIDRLVERIKNRSYGVPIVDTQTTFTEINYVPNFKSQPVTMTCQFCHKLITTRTESSINFLACCCCLLFGVLYCCFQICANKNVCCCDIKHVCPKCGSILGYYNSC
jgi:hypothetical protein